jgi:hypothetical protein
MVSRQALKNFTQPLAVPFSVANSTYTVDNGLNNMNGSSSIIDYATFHNKGFQGFRGRPCKNRGKKVKIYRWIHTYFRNPGHRAVLEVVL